MWEFLPLYVTKIYSPDFPSPSCLLSGVCFLVESRSNRGGYGPCGAPDGEESSVG